MAYKTFNLIFDEKYLDKIKIVADKLGQTKKDFILSAIREKIEREGKK